MKNTLLHCNPARRYVLAGLLSAAALLGLVMNGIAQASGTLDQTFNSTGYVWNGLTWDDYGHAVTVSSNGIIYTAGYTENSQFTQAYVSSYLANGAPNTNFNGNGKKTFHFGNGNFSRAYGLCVQNDGKLLVVGEHAQDDNNSSTRSIGIARLNPDGTFDQDFSLDGQLTVSILNDPNVHSRGRKVIVDSSQMIYVLGTQGALNLAGVKLFPDGELDPSFGMGGTLLWYDSIHFDAYVVGALDIVFQPDGKFIILGWELCGEIGCSSSYYWLGRKFANGYPDGSFGSGNPPHNSFLVGETDELNMGPGGLALQSDGKPIVAGRTKGANGKSLGFVSRLLNNGAIDSTFGTAGKVFISAPGNGDLLFTDIQIQSDDKILCIGSTSGTNNGSDGIYIQRLLSNGATDPSFSFNGNVIVDLPTAESIGGVGMALQSDEKILVCGTADRGTQLGDDSYVIRVHPGPNSVGTQEITEPYARVSVFPNPAVEECSVRFVLSEPAKLTMQLLDFQGRELSTFFVSKGFPAGEQQLSVTLPEDLSAGSYLLVLSSPKGRMSVQVSK